MKNKRHLIFYAIFSTIVSVLFVLFANTAIGSFVFDGTDFSPLLKLPIILLIGAYYIISNVLCCVSYAIKKEASVVFVVVFTYIPISLMGMILVK